MEKSTTTRPVGMDDTGRVVSRTRVCRSENEMDDAMRVDTRRRTDVRTDVRTE